MKIQHWSIDGLRLVEKEFNPAAIIEIKMPNEKRQDRREAALLRRIDETNIGLLKAKKIIKAVCDEYNLTPELLFGDKITLAYQWPCKMAMYRIKLETALNASTIGKLFFRQGNAVWLAFRELDSMPQDKIRHAKKSAIAARNKAIYAIKSKEETQQPTRKPREDYKQSAANSYGFTGELSFEEMEELYAGRSYASKKKSPSSETSGAAESVSVPTFSPTSFGGGG